MEQIFKKHGLEKSRMITTSASGYISENKDKKPIFNASVFAEINGKFQELFFGDLELTEDLSKIESIANELNLTLFILREGEANRYLNFSDFNYIDYDNFQKVEIVHKVSPTEKES